MKATLLIMAAGIGSRFGGGIKQLESVGMNDELIIDFSVHDAIQAGFKKIIFVIRKDIEDAFRERIGNRVEGICRCAQVECCYAFQDMQAIPEGFRVPETRVKPWGTGQAVLAAKEYLTDPFIVINADDYYGKTAFKRMYEWLKEPHKDTEIALAGFKIENTLSKNGSVTRGICKVEQSSAKVLNVVETRNIRRSEAGIIANGNQIPEGTAVSMNMWGFPAADGHCPAFVQVLEEGFKSFFENIVPTDPETAEYLLPTFIGMLLRRNLCEVTLLPTSDKWFGVTYKEDREEVRENVRELIRTGVYNADLYADLLLF